MIKMRGWLALAVFLAGAGVVTAQQRLLTIDDIYDPSTRVNFSGNAPTDLTWIDSTRYADFSGSGGANPPPSAR